ncbi:MAG: TonB-dependent receptor, partial [Verrucomicrobia bacterium]|nr:TonB-dependent receptor [Verrucomicrobiota bacterium]
MAICFSLLTANALGQSSGTGTITGQVSNVSTRAFLQGAVVELSGTDQSTITDREGRYEFTGVPAGPATLIVTFTGLDLQRIVVPVSAGQKVVRDVQLTSNIYQLDKFTVAGMREGTALAATLQRQAPNVKNIVSADTFGNPADGNLGDLLVRLPAISANFVNGDVRSVSIRGTGPDINSVTMDGQRVASAQSANAGRAFEFEQVSMGNLESIEVTKAPTPDMEADSIGGSVNLITKSAFGRSGRTISYTLAGITTSRYKIYKDNKLLQPIKGVGPSMALSYSEVFGEKKNLGIHWNGTYISKPGGEVGQGITFEQNAANSHPYMRVYAGPRQQGAAPQIRAAMGLKVDYKFSEQTVFAFNTSYAFFHEENDSRNLTLTTREEVAAFNAAGQRTGRGTIMPGYNEYYTEASPSASNPADTFVSLSNSGNDKSGRTFLLSPSARHRINGYDIDYNLSYSNAATYYDISQNGSKYDSNPKGTLAYRISGIGFILDRRTGDPRKVSYRQTSGPDMYNLNNYEGLTLSQNDRRGFDRIFSAKLNVRKNLELAVPMFVKTGLNVRKQSRHLWSQNRSYTYTGPDGVMGNADDRQDLAQFLEVSGKHRRENDIYRPPPFMDQYAVARHQKNNPELWKENITTSTVSKLQNQQEADETVSSAYVMGNARFGPLSVLAGVRLEETKVNGEGPLQYVSPAEAARRAAWVGPVTDAEARRRAETEWGGRDTASGKYRNSFPGIHFKYEPMKGLVLRASYSNGIGRPSFGNLIPLTVPNDVNQTVSVRNTNLKPQYADNLDVSAEYYFEPAGLLSAGVYRKNLTNFIFTDNSRIVAAGPNNGFEGEYEGYRLSTQANGGSARIEGIEFNYQQQLKLNRLPKWAQGFG